MASTKCAVVNGIRTGEASGSTLRHLDLDGLAGELDRLDRDVGSGRLQAGPLELGGPGVPDLPGHRRSPLLVEQAHRDGSTLDVAADDGVEPLVEAVAGLGRRYAALERDRADLLQPGLFPGRELRVGAAAVLDELGLHREAGDLGETGRVLRVLPA